jgi:hypothetical protein
MRSPFVALCALALSPMLCSAAGAADPGQPAPSPSPTPIVLPTMPPSAPQNPYVKMGIDAVNSLLHGAHERNANNAQGQVTYFKRFEMQIRTGPSAYRSIHLHQGTVINPRGASLGTGQTVRVSGVAQSDGSLNANEIDVTSS